MSSFPFSGAILAGGRSSRMGRDKAFIEIDGATLVARQAALLREAGAAELLISGRPGVDYSVPHARVVIDKIQDAGPLGGLSAILHTSRNPWVLILAVDLPHVTLAALNLLLTVGNGVNGAVPRDQHGYEPLLALYPVTLLPLIDDALAEKQFGLQPLLKRSETFKMIQSVHKSVFSGETFENWNTPGHITGNSP